MNFSLIVAMTEKTQVIGNYGKMPWHLPADLAYFKATTLNKTIVMGRNTYLAIGKALPQRRNIVLSRQPDYQLADAEVVPDIAALAQICAADEEIMIIGGGQIYQQFLPLSQQLYITWIAADLSGDTHFPAVDWQAWQMSAEQKQTADAHNPYNYRFCHYQRR